MAGGSCILTPLSDIEARPLEWLWPDRIPLGKVTLMAGDPSLGKSLVTLDMAARVSRGLAWPDGDFGGDGTVDYDDFDVWDVYYQYGMPARSVTRTWQWGLDALGNWREYKYDEGDGQTWKLEQTRAHNKVNEIHTSDDHSTSPDVDAIKEGQGQTAWVSPAHDAAGNMTSGPKAGDETTRLHGVYDAWNRMVALKKDDGGKAGDTVAVYRYDGLNRRIAKAVANGENWDRTDYYYNESWQCLEERFASAQGSQDTVATTPKVQWLWDIRYIDAPVLRWRDDNDDTDFSDAGETLYYSNDANMNVTALVSASSGSVVERYVYSPYGSVTIYDDDWSDTVTWANSKKNEILFCGYRWDPESGNYHVRHRYYNPTMGRFASRDPIGYADGMNLYEYAGASPLQRRDASGLNWLGDTLSEVWAWLNTDCCGKKRYRRDKECCANRAKSEVLPEVPASDVQGFVVAGPAETLEGGLFGPLVSAATHGLGHATIFNNGYWVRDGYWQESPTVDTSQPYSEYPRYKKFVLTRVSSGELQWGSRKGLECRCATAEMIKDCLRKCPKPCDPFGKIFNNCQMDVEFASKQCCLTGFSYFWPTVYGQYAPHLRW